MCNLAWHESFVGEVQWHESLDKALGAVVCFFVPLSAVDTLGNSKHWAHTLSNIFATEELVICVALDLISSSTDSRGLTEMKWCEGAPDSHSTLNLVVSLGWWAGQEQQRIDGTAERVSIQVFWQGNVGIKKETVYWLGTLCVSMECNHNLGRTYLLHTEATQWTCRSWLFINILSAKNIV